MPEQNPHLYLIGHAFEGDFGVLEETGIRFTDFYDLAGIIDTKILIEDMHETVDAGTDWPLGLPPLVLRYGLHDQIWSQRARNGKGAPIFKGAHNGGNDAIANLEVLFCLILDQTFGIDYFDCDEGAFLTLANVTMHRDTKPMINPRSNSIFMCFDSEGGGGRTSEYGWAWVHSSDMCRTTPGHQGSNWRPLIKARHYLSDDYWNHPGSHHTDGKQHGFWTAYGSPTQRYYPASGAQPFHDMFRSMITAIPPQPPSTNTSQPSSLPPHLQPPRNPRLPIPPSIDAGMSRAQPPSTNTSQSSSLPPHLQPPRNPRLPSPPLIAGGADALTPENEVEDQYVECLKMTCADNLEGFKCRTKESCANRLKLCPNFSNPSKRCSFVGFRHGLGTEERFHIRKTCRAVLLGEVCDRLPDCSFGHDHEDIRRAVDRARRLQARINHVKNGRPLPYVGR